MTRPHHFDGSQADVGRSGNATAGGTTIPDPNSEAYAHREFLRLLARRVAQAWIADRSWPFDPATARPEPLTVKSIRYRLSNWIERATGRRPLEHRPFQPID